MTMHTTSNNKEANKSPGRGGKHHEPIRTHGIIPRRMYKQNTGSIKKVGKYNI